MTGVQTCALPIYRVRTIASRAKAARPFAAAFTAAVDICFAHAHLITPEVTAALELFVLQTALATMWAAWGVVPTVLTGHSFSKYAALDRTGVLEFPDTLALVSVHAALMLLRHAKCHGRAAAVPPRPARAACVAVHQIKIRRCFV